MLSCSYGENLALALAPAGFAIRNPALARFGKSKSSTISNRDGRYRPTAVTNIND